MILAEFRLKKERNFEILFKEGEFISSDTVNLKYWSVNNEKYPDRFDEGDLKIGFVVSTDISNKAVDRNKKKRQLREAVKQILSEFGLKKGYLLAFIANEEIKSSDFSKIKTDIKKLLKKTDILCLNS